MRRILNEVARMKKIAGIITEDQFREALDSLNNTLEEGLPMGKSKLAQQVANTLNTVVGKIQRPDLADKARALAGQIISLIDEDSMDESINEGLPMGKSKLSQEVANTLNTVVGKIQRPDLAGKVRALAGQIISLIDQDQD